MFTDTVFFSLQGWRFEIKTGNLYFLDTNSGRDQDQNRCSLNLGQRWENDFHQPRYQNWDKNRHRHGKLFGMYHLMPTVASQGLV